MAIWADFRNFSQSNGGPYGKLFSPISLTGQISQLYGHISYLHISPGTVSDYPWWIWPSSSGKSVGLGYSAQHWSSPVN